MSRYHLDEYVFSFVRSPCAVRTEDA
jgi:hypothetical protein